MAPTHPVAAYVYAEDRKGSRPAGHLAAFRGVLQVDGYGGFRRLGVDRADSSVTLAFCWAHRRRGFYEFHVSTKSPLAAWVLAKVDDLDFLPPLTHSTYVLLRTKGMHVRPPGPRK